MKKLIIFIILLLLISSNSYSSNYGEVLIKCKQEEIPYTFKITYNDKKGESLLKNGSSISGFIIDDNNFHKTGTFNIFVSGSVPTFQVVEFKVSVGSFSIKDDNHFVVYDSKVQPYFVNLNSSDSRYLQSMNNYSIENSTEFVKRFFSFPGEILSNLKILSFDLKYKGKEKINAGIYSADLTISFRSC